MTTKVINTREEFENFYFYDKKYMTEDHYPTTYPCLATKEERDAGIAGSQVVHNIFYCPDEYDIKSFFAGLEKGLRI